MDHMPFCRAMGVLLLPTDCKKPKVILVEECPVRTCRTSQSPWPQTAKVKKRNSIATTAKAGTRRVRHRCAGDPVLYPRFPNERAYHAALFIAGQPTSLQSIAKCVARWRSV